MEDLLKPRYKVIADYPNSPFNIGEVLIHIDGNNYKSSEIEGQIYTDRYPERYPAIFRKMDWWEDRKTEEMPEYVKKLHSGEVVKPIGYDLVSNMVIISEKFRQSLCYNILPATLSEYLEQITNKK